MEQSSIQDIARRLMDRIRRYGPCAVAFSGGVDSAVVAKAAVLVLEIRAVAVTAVSPSLAAVERRDAIELAKAIGIRHVMIQTSEFDRPEYRANAGNRCFYCKDTLYSVTKNQLDELGVSVILNGANLDDLGDHRPGMQAAADHHVCSPLIEEGIDKGTVRELARYWQLNVAEKPASPCLASRIAYGVEVTPERVGRVERAEAFIRELTGITQLRVRCEANELARIEVPAAAVQRLAADPIRSAIAECLRAEGFRFITLDLEGFRSGSLNSGPQFVQLGRH